MTEPFDPEEDLIPIDVRSPGERMADSGRAGYERMRGYLRPERLAIAALVWMLAIAVTVGVNVWQAISLGREITQIGDGVWIELALIAQTGDMNFAIAAFAGLALVALGGAARARVAAYVGVVIGGWIVVASAIGITVAVHGGLNPFAALLSNNRFAAGVGFIADAALGVVIVGIALALASAGSVAEVS